MKADVSIHAIGPPERDLLIAMYGRFDPLGAALGLPPGTAEARHMWIGSALAQILNVAAFSPGGEVVGHCFLAADKPGSAEVAVFVHQESRRRGLGTALLKKALEWGWAATLKRVWGVIAGDNRAALRLLMSCGFRLVESACDVAALDIDLGAGREMPRPVREFPFGGQGENIPGCTMGPRPQGETLSSAAKEGVGAGPEEQPRWG